jgi:hypothetical protein
MGKSKCGSHLLVVIYKIQANHDAMVSSSYKIWIWSLRLKKPNFIGLQANLGIGKEKEEEAK